MKRILVSLIGILLFWEGQRAFADTCATNLMPAFTANQAKGLCKTFGSAVNQSLIPSANNTYDLGTSALAWKTGYFGTSIISTATDGAILTNTSDAADNKSIALAGGGSASNSRGGRIVVSGNEYASTGGAVTIVGGATSTGAITLQTQNASAGVDIQVNGLSRWVFGAGALTGDATNGGDIILSKSGAAISVQENSSSTACMGVGAPTGTTPVVVTTSCATLGARVFYSRNGAVTNNNVITTTTAPNGTSFAFASTGAGDTGGASVVWLIVKESA